MGASRRETGFDPAAYVTVELLAIGLGTIALGAIVYFGLIPVFGYEAGLGSALVGTGVGVALYSTTFVQGSVSMQSVTLGIAFLTFAVIRSEGIWAGVVGVWGIALVIMGVAAYGFVVLSRRGSRG